MNSQGQMKFGKSAVSGFKPLNPHKFLVVFLGIFTLVSLTDFARGAILLPLCITPVLPTQTWTGTVSKTKTPTYSFTPSSTATFSLTYTSTASATPTPSVTLTPAMTSIPTQPPPNPTFTSTPTFTMVSPPTPTLTPPESFGLYFSDPYPNPNDGVVAVHFRYNLPTNVIGLGLFVYTVRGEKIYDEVIGNMSTGSYAYALDWNRPTGRWANGVYFFTWRVLWKGQQWQFVRKVLVLR